MAPKIGTFKLSQLKPAKYSPRTIGKDAFEGLAASIARFGCVEPIVVNIRGKKKTIIGGHQRYKVLIDMHGKSYRCSCVTVDLKRSDEKLLNLTLNNPKIQGQFIKELANYIDELRKSLTNDQDYLTFRINQLRREFRDAEKQGHIQDDDIPRPPRKTITKPGDLWILGKHRLLCGDSTNEKDVGRLMNKQKASLFATDPPYCVDYTGNDRPHNQGKDWSDVYREVDIDDPKIFIRDFYTVGLRYVKRNTALYLWHSSMRRALIEAVCKEFNFQVHQQIIWVKPFAVLTYSVYLWRHEPCLLMWQKGCKPDWRNRSMDNRRLNSVWPIGYVKSGDPTTPEYYTDVWELDWDGKKRNPGIEHPTVKPVEVFAIPMRVHTDPGDICYEPFCGSGSQLIAAEKLDRRCFAMELEPFFCDVAVKRWEEWTGRKARLIKGTKGRKRKKGV